jgi:hypothetical protein
LRLRERARDTAARVFGERAVPVGGVARDRRLLKRALSGGDPGDVLVVGPSLAARQALHGRQVDVADTVPSPEVTVCSAVRVSGSLPPGRWDTVVVADPGPSPQGRLAAVREACRPGARVLLLDHCGDDATAPGPAALAAVAHPGKPLGRGRRRLWPAEVVR